MKVDEQKKKLEQKKQRLILEEARLRTKEQKARTRRLIELGGLFVKAKLDHLKTTTVYGTLLSLKEELEQNPEAEGQYSKLGAKAFELEQKDKTALIVKFEAEPEEATRKAVRAHGLKFNRFRSEWYGYARNLEGLKKELKKQNTKYELEVI